MAATVRGVLSGVALLARSGAEVRFFGGHADRLVAARGALVVGRVRAGRGAIARGIAALRTALGAGGARF